MIFIKQINNIIIITRCKIKIIFKIKLKIILKIYQFIHKKMNK